MEMRRKRRRRNIEKMKDLERFRNIHEGKKCFICGAGCSIGFLDLEGIHSYPVICVNSSILLMPWKEPGDVLSRFWVSTDVLCIQWDYFWSKVVRWECTRVVRNSWSRSSEKTKGIQFYYYHPRQNPTSIPEGTEKGLMAGSSILSAMDLALLLGCKQIFLLGVDHRMHNGNSHFWQVWPVKDRPKREGKPGNFMPCQRQQSSVFKSNLRQFELLAEYANGLDAKIYNCSHISQVPTFDRISLEDALKL